MSDSSLAVTFLGVISGCLLIIAVTLVVMAVALCWSLAQLHARLQEADDALRHAQVSLQQADQFFTRVNRVSRHAETAFEQFWAAAWEAWTHLGSWGQRIKTFWGGHVGNGARAESRRHHRQGTRTRRRVVG